MKLGIAQAGQTVAQKPVARLLRVGLAVSLMAPMIGHEAALGQIQFDDATATAGILGQGETWGSSWGDYNGDGWKDLFVNGHRGVPRLYRNNADGSFTDVARELDPGIWFSDPYNDQHGASWVDFDNDGDQDLYVNVSVTGPGQLLVNEGGLFWEAAATADLSDDGAARGSTWFDWTGDGYLDVAIIDRANRLNRQDPSQGLDFDRDTTTGVNCPGRKNYGQLVDLDDDGSLEFLCVSEGLFPNRAYDVSTLPFTDVTGSIPRASNVNDTVVADFDGDLRNDIFMTRGALRPSGASLLTPTRIEGWLASSSDIGKGFVFGSPGEITVTVDFSGLGGFQPPAVMVLDPAGSYVGSAGPVDASYDSTSNRWELSIAGANERAYIVVETVEPVTDLEVFGLDTPEYPIPPRLLKNYASGAAFDYSAGFSQPISCVSAAAGDFDNDTDQDLYLVCRNGVENLPNRLYENQGDGSFVMVEGAGGGEGLVGFGLTSGVGVGEAVTVADYDADGFLDLFITNGLLMRPWGVGGRDMLLRNRGNENHWLQLDLQGTDSNRDGVGARVYVTADGKTQLREQNGGYHRWSQNDQRMHFGLATDATADITVHWPSGNVDNFAAVPADRIYTLTESGSLVETPLGPPLADGLVPGDECGEPTIDAAVIQGVWIWKNCSTGRWSMRISAGGSPEVIAFSGALRADANFGNVSEYLLEGGDFVDTTDPSAIVFGLAAKNAGVDGIDFDSPADAGACLALDAPVGAPVYVGQNARSGQLPFALDSLGTCGSLVDVLDVSVEESAGIATVTVALSQTAGSPVTVDYTTSDVSAMAGLDYVSTAGQVVIDAGSLSATFDVPLNDDSLLEDDETFAIMLSNPVNAFLREASATVTIQDDDGGACGEPAYDKSSEAGLFLWRDCNVPGPGQTWHVRVTGGGSASVITYAGTLTALLAPGTTGVSLEGNDKLDTLPGDLIVDFALRVGGAGWDGFQLDLPAGADACFSAETLPVGATVQLGAARQTIHGPFALDDQGPCAASLSVADSSVDESAGLATVSVSLSALATSQVTVDYTVTDGTAEAGIDYTVTTGQAVIEAGSASTTFDVVLLDDQELEGDETFEVVLSNPVNAVLGQPGAIVTILDDESVQCGEPSIDRANDLGVFVWRDCFAPGPDQVWHMRVTGGGSTSTIVYGGSVSPLDGLNVSGFSLEGNDSLDTVPDDDLVDYVMKVVGTGWDGFQMNVPAGVDACFAADLLPAGASVRIGSGGMVMGSAFSLSTLQACIP